MKYFYALLIFQFILLSAQAQPIQWQKAFGSLGVDNFRSVTATTDGGYIAVGESNGNNGDISGNHGDYDYLVVKFSSTGVVEWNKVYGGTGYDFAYSVKQTTDGGYIIAGVSNSINGDISGNHGFADGWVIKLSSTGIIQWQRSYGSTSNDEIRSIQLTPDGGYVFAGYCGSADGDALGSGCKGPYDFWVIKTNSTGDIQWQKAYGSTNTEIANDIKITSDGGYILTGITRGNDGDVLGNHNTGTGDIWVLKITNTGTIQWQKCLGGGQAPSSNSLPEDIGYSIQPTNDGGYILTGEVGSIDGDITNYKGGIRDAWVVKLSSTGTLVWQRCLGGQGADEGRSIITTIDGGYIMLGITANAYYPNNGDVDLAQVKGNDDYWLIKFSPTGSIPLQKIIGSSGGDRASSIQATNDGGFILVGSVGINDKDAAGNTFHGSEQDAWIIKLTPNALPVSTVDFVLNKIDKNVQVSWKTAQEINTSYFNVQRSLDGLTFNTIAKVIAAGNSSMMKSYSFVDRDILGLEKLFYRLQIIDKDNSSTVTSILSIKNTIEMQTSVFPNPGSNYIDINTGNLHFIRILNAEGKLYYAKENPTNHLRLNISGWPKGYYTIQLFNDFKQILSSKKFLIL